MQPRKRIQPFPSSWLPTLCDCARNPRQPNVIPITHLGHRPRTFATETLLLEVAWSIDRIDLCAQLLLFALVWVQLPSFWNAPPDNWQYNSINQNIFIPPGFCPSRMSPHGNAPTNQNFNISLLLCCILTVVPHGNLLLANWRDWAVFLPSPPSFSVAGSNATRNPARDEFPSGARHLL